MLIPVSNCNIREVCGEVVPWSENIVLIHNFRHSVCTITRVAIYLNMILHYQEPSKVVVWTGNLVDSHHVVEHLGL